MSNIWRLEVVADRLNFVKLKRFSPFTLARGQILLHSHTTLGLRTETMLWGLMYRPVIGDLQTASNGKYSGICHEWVSSENI